MSTLSERVRLALNDSELSQSDLARRVGIAPASVNGWLSGSTKSLKAETANKAAKALGVNTLWLISGQGEMKPTANQNQQPKDDVVILKKYDVAASCGPGAEPMDGGSRVEELVVTRSWFFANVSSLRTQGYDIITASGDSMEPTFSDGDILIIDTLEKDLRRRDGCYVFFYDGQIYAKRIQLTPPGFLIISDNPLYKTFTIPYNSCVLPTVFGRIVKGLIKKDFN